jgi:hypothetical protein
LPVLLYRMALLDLRAGRTGDAAAQLREAIRLALRTGAVIWNMLDYSGHLCAATGRPAEAVTMWAAYAALIPQDLPGDARLREEPPRCSAAPAGPGRPSSAARR